MFISSTESLISCGRYFCSCYHWGSLCLPAKLHLIFADFLHLPYTGSEPKTSSCYILQGSNSGKGIASLCYQQHAMR
jgi:hypothetical protein